eukprot:TRINITY_DN81714_c0_g1_i1.p1 TRINITY_DN81714_c0_g1~~TRINITY_DN81714_c0_g1_i1.p1  ORF type:complete len:750 (-),score=146.20 TRINITY_DN81714_c0_g1_i1:378-2627(-)
MPAPATSLGRHASPAFVVAAEPPNLARLRHDRVATAPAAPGSITAMPAERIARSLERQHNAYLKTVCATTAVGLLAGLQRAGRLRRAAKNRNRLRRRIGCASAGDDASLATRSQRLVFFGGKGGVGKTSSSTAYAAGLAAEGLRTLVLSTDPAHSLGDALSETLSGKPQEIAENLFAAEIDPEEALAELRSGLKALDAKALLDKLGLPGGTTAALGLNELSELLDSPPPGFDEIAAMARTSALAENFDVIVFDTAPTGHTLRMLDVPKFILSFIDKALSIRKSVGGVLGMFNLGGAATEETMDEAEAQVRLIRERVNWLASALKTPPGAGQTTAEFIVVTRPTELDFAEAERLVGELKRQGVSCAKLIVNQIVDPGSGDAYWKTRMQAQQEVVQELRPVCANLSLPLLEVADSPESLVGVPALTYLASLVYGGGAQLPGGEVILFGGKGGVGKTSMSSSLAVHTAGEGKRVLIISTDPAHSLGDALATKLFAKPTQVDSFAGAGELWAMEVDTAAAMTRFQETAREALQQRQSQGGIVGQVLDQLPMGDFIGLFDTLPPGSDEIVALVDVLEEVRKEKFDRIIIDTAPTGHALRLLSFPDFLERLADRVARLRDRFGWLSGDGDGKDPLRSFQLRMIELQDLFTDPEKASFAVVTIPTRLALEETKRLVKELGDEDIRVGMVIVNRLLNAEQAEASMNRLMATQQTTMDKLEGLAQRENLKVLRINYVDREVRGIHGLRYLGSSLMDLA